MTLLSRLSRLAAWLRAAGRRGDPWHNDIPLLALTGRLLTEDDVTLIAGELAFSPSPDSEEEIRRAIKAITRMSVNDPDVARVRARLTEGR